MKISPRMNSSTDTEDVNRSWASTIEADKRSEKEVINLHGVEYNTAEHQTAKRSYQSGLWGCELTFRETSQHKSLATRLHGLF